MSEKYYNEILELIKEKEANHLVREYQDNNETLKANWKIGKLLVEAQGGEERTKYGDNLIKKWSKKFIKEYGKGYDESNLKRFRLFYLTFPKSGSLSHQLTWTHYRYLLPIKNENERNYYINQKKERQ